MPNSVMIYEIEPGDKYYHQAFNLRYSLFFQKHGLPESIVKDKFESYSRHFAVIESDTVIAYGRLTKIKNEVYKISQMAVREDKQKMGFGSIILKHLINIAEKNGGREIILNARIPFIKFYQKHGFSSSGNLFLSESTELPHQPMTYKQFPDREITMNKLSTNQFAAKWEKSWNSHDIQKIMEHYASDIVLISPIAGKLLGNPEVKGFEAVKDYFIKGLQAYPDLKFRVLDVLYGEKSIVLYYVNQNNVKAGEFMQFGTDGKIIRMHAHYSES